MLRHSRSEGILHPALPAVAGSVDDGPQQVGDLYHKCICFIILTAYTDTRRQEDLQAVGPAFDGSFGVDSQDILNIPDMDFGSFQLLPDQNNYGLDDPSLSPFENVVQQGNEWIRQHGETAARWVQVAVGRR